MRTSPVRPARRQARPRARRRRLVERFAAGEQDAVTDPAATRLAASVADRVRPGRPVDVRRLQALEHFHLARFQLLDEEPDLQRAMTYYAALHPTRPDLVPQSLHEVIEENADGTRLLRRAIEDDDPAVLDGPSRSSRPKPTTATPPC